MRAPYHAPASRRSRRFACQSPTIRLWEASARAASCFSGLAQPLAGGPHAGGLAPARRRASLDLEQPQLLGGHRGLLVGGVLFAGEHAVEQHGELARNRDDRDVVAAAGAEAPAEGVQRPGLLGDRTGGLDQRPARPGRTLL